MQNATLSNLKVTPVPGDYAIRLPPQVFLAFWGLFVFFVFLPGLSRIAFRLYLSRRLFLDDYLVLFAILCLLPAAVLSNSIHDLIYQQVWTGIGLDEPPPNFYPEMLIFEQRIMASSALLWAALYSIKFAFLVFFKKLVSRVQGLVYLWWATVVLCGMCALISIPLAFIACPHLTEDYMDYCPIASQLANEKIYLIATCVMDVVTDVLILVIPLLLLWPLQLGLGRKLGLMCMLSLSSFMIVIAIVRVTGSQLPNGVVDTSWLVFWSGMEAAVAVLMVSLLVLKSMFAVENERRSERQRRLDQEKGLISSSISSSSPTSPWRSWRDSFRRSAQVSSADQPDQVQRYRWNPTQSFAAPQAIHGKDERTEGGSHAVKQAPDTKRTISVAVHEVPRSPGDSPLGQSLLEADRSTRRSPTFLIDRSRHSSPGPVAANPRLMSRYFPDS